MKYIALFGALSFVFMVLQHFSAQRSKHWERELRQFKASAERAEQREAYRR